MDLTSFAKGMGSNGARPPAPDEDAKGPGGLVPPAFAKGGMPFGVGRGPMGGPASVVAPPVGMPGVPDKPIEGVPLDMPLDKPFGASFGASGPSAGRSATSKAMACGGVSPSLSSPPAAPPMPSLPGSAMNKASALARPPAKAPMDAAPLASSNPEEAEAQAKATEKAPSAPPARPSLGAFLAAATEKASGGLPKDEKAEEKAKTGGSALRPELAALLTLSAGAPGVSKASALAAPTPEAGGDIDDKEGSTPKAGMFLGAGVRPGLPKAPAKLTPPASAAAKMTPPGNAQVNVRAKFSPKAFGGGFGGANCGGPFKGGGKKGGCFGDWSGKGWK